VTVETADQASFKTARTVAPNRSLSDLVDLRVRKIGMDGDDNYNGIFVGYWHTLSNGDRRCQVQYNDGSYLKCAVLVFSRSDNGIQVKALKCIYRSLGWYGDKTILDDDLYARLEKGNDDGTKDTNNAVYYWISDMDLMFSAPERSELIMSGPVTCSPCEISVSSGVDAAISNSAALPPGSVINVGPDARASVCRSNAGTLAEVRVEQGGRFTVKWWDAVEAGTRVRLYGGEIDVDSSSSSAPLADSGAYVNHIDFHDGARLFSSSDRGVRVGGNPACYRVRGDSASRVDCPLLLVKNDSCPFVIDVADVTGDGEVDFTLAGALKDQGNSTKGHAVRKEGEGTLLLTAAASATGPLTVVAGVLRLGAADAAKTFASLKLEGGALASDAAQKLPALNLAGNAVLDCSSSGAYSFGDSSSVAWTDGARLEINSFRQGAVRFGTSSEALTLRQMRQLRIGGRSVRLDGEGYVVPKDPLVIFLR
jgi:autotransporter-associated beta strand protein